MAGKNRVLYTLITKDVKNKKGGDFLPLSDTSKKSV
jgi:hypothetical protein